MDAALEASLRDQLLDRRRRLTTAVSETGEAADLVRLLQQVDGALKRIDARVFGICEVCEEPVDAPDLAANPLLPWCLCKLSPEQQTALSNDLELAGRIQMSLLPKQDLEALGYEVHHRYLPLGPASGDFLDLVARDGEGLFFLLGDVSGKGVAAALLMARLNAMFRSLVDLRLPIEEMVERANRLFSETKLSTHYATLVAGRASFSGGLELCNAGHVAPLLLGGDGVRPLDSSGLPVGLFGPGPYHVHRLEMRPGDTLFLYTDGLTEAFAPSGEEYGAERLSRVLGAAAKLSPRRIAASVLEDQRRFLAGSPRSDDLTLMVLRHAPAGLPI